MHFKLAVQVELTAVYAPQTERSINYNVVVNVRNKATPLVLNVKGEGYALQPNMLLELPDDASLELSPSGTNTIDFGKVGCGACHESRDSCYSLLSACRL